MRSTRVGTEQAEVATSVLRQCRVCTGPVDFALSAREMMIGTHESFDYFECRDCGCLQIAGVPTDLDRYYAGSYYTKSQRIPAGRASGRFGLRRAWTRFRLLESGLARAMSGPRYARFEWFRRTRTDLHDEILDVGCGSGRLLRRLHAEGFEQLTGIDVQLEEGVQEDSSFVFERSSPEEHRGRYHLVMSHHSFEHMQDPVRGFAAFARLVEPGGYLLLRLPIADCWARRHYAAD